MANQYYHFNDNTDKHSFLLQLSDLLTVDRRQLTICCHEKLFKNVFSFFFLSKSRFEIFGGFLELSQQNTPSSVEYMHMGKMWTWMLFQLSFISFFSSVVSICSRVKVGMSAVKAPYRAVLVFLQVGVRSKIQQCCGSGSKG